MYLVGVDIGTQSTKSVITDENGRVIAEASKEYSVLTPQPNWAEQWPNVWFDAVIDTLKLAVEKGKIDPKTIAGIAISGLYGGSGIPVDKDFNPLRPCLIWMDRRATKETDWVKNNVPKETLFEITGNYVDSYFGFTKIIWIKNNEKDIWEKTYKFITPKDFVIQKLTGEVIIDFSSAGNIGGIFNIHKKYWSEEMCKILGIDLDKLPEKIVKSSEIVGTLNKTYAQEIGLLEGTPIIAGGIDAPVAQLSAGSVNEGEHVAMVGTSTCWGNIHDGKYLTPELVSFPYVVDDLTKIYTFGGGATSGAIVKWFREEFGEYEKEFERKRGISAYSLLELESKDIPPGSNGIIVLPYFMGERSPVWESSAKGTIIGLNLYHKRSHLYKAFMESVAYSLRHNMEYAENTGMKLNSECYLVGGASKSDIWTQIFADVTGYIMKRTMQDVEAPLGDAFLAGLGTGVFHDSQDIKKWVKFKENTSPNTNNKGVYDKYFSLYKKVYENTKEIMKQL